MDKAKKKATGFAAVVASVMLLIALTAASAFGAQEGDKANGSITIDNAVKGQTYSVYQILYLESYNADANAYAYKANSAWAGFLNGEDVKGVYVNVDDQGYVTWNVVTRDTAGYEEATEDELAAANDAAAAAFAKAALAYAKEQGFSSDSAAITADGAEVKFNDLKLGYYLVDSSLGTLCSLDTTNPSVTIKEKNGEPTNDKQVQENSTNNYGSENDSAIGDTVNFKSTITLPKGSENIVFHDTMSEGLTLNADSIKVYTDGNLSAELVADNYAVITAGCKDGCTFEVSFEKDYLDGLSDAITTVYVAYSATVNESAVVGGDGNKNESKVSYGEDGTTTTTPSTTETYTWDFDVFKYTEDGETEKPLAGATFTLSKNNDGSSPINLVAAGDNVYRVAMEGDANTVAEITTDTTGKFAIKGLDSDTYYLTETKAPDGYNKLDGPVTVVVGGNGVVNATDDAPQGVDEVKVLNQSGSELPSTGGMGTALLYVVGGLLVVGAGIGLVVRLRSRSND